MSISIIIFISSNSRLKPHLHNLELILDRTINTTNTCQVFVLAD